jgi:hypothetical protein
MGWRDDDDQLLTRKEGASFLRCSESQVKKWGDLGVLLEWQPGHGRAVRYRFGELRAFVRAVASGALELPHSPMSPERQKRLKALRAERKRAATAAESRVALVPVGARAVLIPPGVERVVMPAPEAWRGELSEAEYWWLARWLAFVGFQVHIVDADGVVLNLSRAPGRVA